MNSKPVILILLVTISFHLFGQKATIREEMVTMKTYMFSDPNPVPEINRIYPYFRFDGYCGSFFHDVVTDFRDASDGVQTLHARV